MNKCKLVTAVVCLLLASCSTPVQVQDVESVREPDVVWVSQTVVDQTNHDTGEYMSIKPALMESEEEAPQDPPFTVTYVGEFNCTAYCCEKYGHICGTGSGITASGDAVTAGVTVAADTDVFPFGTVLYIEGVGIRIVQDRGGAVKGNHLDVAVDTHQDALNWGQEVHAVYVVNVPEEVGYDHG